MSKIFTSKNYQNLINQKVGKNIPIFKVIQKPLMSNNRTLYLTHPGKLATWREVFIYLHDFNRNMTYDFLNIFTDWKECQWWLFSAAGGDGWAGQGAHAGAGELAAGLSQAQEAGVWRDEG